MVTDAKTKKDSDRQEEVFIKTGRPKDKLLPLSKITTQAESFKDEEKPTVYTPQISQKLASFSQLDENKKLDVSEDSPEKPVDENVGTEPNDEEKSEVTPEDVKKWIKDVGPQIEGESSSNKTSNLSKLLWVFLFLLIVGLVVGGVFYYKSRVSQTNEEPVNPQPTEVESSPTLSQEKKEDETKKVDFKKYSLSVLNGSGIPGEAADAKSLLEKAGFANIKTGNATSYNSMKTTVALKDKTPEEVYKEIEKVFSDKYQLEKDTKPLTKDSSFDVVITVGPKK